MNYMVIEGIGLYLFLALLLALVLLSVACLICAAYADRRNLILWELLKCETLKNKMLSKANFKLKLKYGELSTDD